MPGRRTRWSVSRFGIGVIVGSVVTGATLYGLSVMVSKDRELLFVPEEAHVRFEAVDLPNCLAQDELERAVEDAISLASACRSDDQCVVRYYGCPFGCRATINADLEPRVQAAHDEYVTFVESRNCGRCVYRCAPVANPSPVCRDGKCTLDPA